MLPIIIILITIIIFAGHILHYDTLLNAIEEMMKRFAQSIFVVDIELIGCRWFLNAFVNEQRGAIIWRNIVVFEKLL